MPATPAASPVPPAAPTETPSAIQSFDTGAAFADLSAAPAPAKPAPAAPPKPPEKPAAAPPKEDVVVEDGVEMPKKFSTITNKEFKGWGLAGYKKAKELQTQLDAKTQIETEYAQLKEQHPRTLQEKQALATQVEQLRKDYDAVMSELKLTRYERSADYGEKYRKPYDEAVERALAQTKELLVTVPDPSGELDEDNQPKMTERAATEADFEHIFQMPLGQATREAKKLFGDSASIVLGHREKIKDLAMAAQKAIQEWKSKAAELEKQEHARSIEEQDRLANFWIEVNKRLGADPRGAEFWGEEKDNKEANTELAKGLAYADQRYSDAYEKMTEREKVLLDASLRWRVGGFYKLRYLVSKVKAENEQLKKDLAELRGSAPGAPGPVSPEKQLETESEGPIAEFDKKL